MILAIVIGVIALVIAAVIILSQRCDIDRLMLDKDILERAEDRLCKSVSELTKEKNKSRTTIEQLRTQITAQMEAGKKAIAEIDSLTLLENQLRADNAALRALIKSNPSPKPQKRKKRSCLSTVE